MPSPTPPAASTGADTVCRLPRRLMSMLYDALIILALLIIASAFALPLTGEQVRAGESFGFTVYLLAVWFAYLGWCWSQSGQTLGMRAWKIRIHDLNGRLPGWRECAVRFAVSWASAACLGLGFISALLRKDRSCWHDLASNTSLYRYRD